MHLDAAEARRKPHQIWEGELRTRVIVPAGVRVLGRDAVGLDTDVLDLAGIDLFVVHQAEQRFDRRLDVAAAGIRLDVAVGDAERRIRRECDRPRLVGTAERESLHEAVARLDHVGGTLHAKLREQRRLDTLARGVPRVQALDVRTAVNEREQTGRHAGGDTERVGDLLRGEAAQLRHRQRRAEWPDRAGRMEAALAFGGRGGPRSFPTASAAPNGPTALVGWKPRWRRSGAQARARQIATS